MRAFRKPFSDVAVYDPSKAFNGYTLFATMHGQDAWLIDMTGQIVHHWLMENIPGPYGHLLPNGNLLWLGRGTNLIEEFRGSATELVEADWQGREVWRLDDNMLNHDFVRLENGNTLINRYVPVPENIARRIRGGLPNTTMDGVVYSCSFQEITREKEVVWEWKHYEHLDPEKDVICPLCPQSIWGYTNAMDVFPNGDILFTLRFLNTICILDRKTGQIKWRWGPEAALGHPHNCSVLENGNILLLDNGFHRRPTGNDDADLSEQEYSRVLEVNVEKREIVWEYVDRLNAFYTTFCGGTQRLPNGNTLICESMKGRFFEVTPEKEIVWEYRNPFLTMHPPAWTHGWFATNETFRCYRYAPGFDGFKGKDLNPDNFEWVVRRKTEKNGEDK